MTYVTGWAVRRPDLTARVSDSSEKIFAFLTSQRDRIEKRLREYLATDGSAHEKELERLRSENKSLQERLEHFESERRLMAVE